MPVLQAVDSTGVPRFPQRDTLRVLTLSNMELLVGWWQPWTKNSDLGTSSPKHILGKHGGGTQAQRSPQRALSPALAAGEGASVTWVAGPRGQHFFNPPIWDS